MSTNRLSSVLVQRSHWLRDLPWRHLYGDLDLEICPVLSNFLCVCVFNYCFFTVPAFTSRLTKRVVSSFWLIMVWRALSQILKLSANTGVSKTKWLCFVLSLLATLWPLCCHSEHSLFPSLVRYVAVIFPPSFLAVLLNFFCKSFLFLGLLQFAAVL